MPLPRPGPLLARLKPDGSTLGSTGMQTRAFPERAAKAPPRVMGHVAGRRSTGPAFGSNEAAIEHVLQLQRTFGNQAVQRLLHPDAASTAVQRIDVKEVSVSLHKR